MLHDTHFHLDLFNKDFLSVANKIEHEKIYTIAVTNLPPLYNQLEKKLMSGYKYIRPALGFHPELIGEYYSLVPKMWDLLPQARYIGEVGLDYQTGFDFKNKQISFFETLIEKCDSLGGKILTIHSRKSADDVISIMGNDFNGKYILHWYSGNLKTLRKAIVNGAYFSINFPMTQSTSGRKIISEIPINRLLLESDGPFTKFQGELFTPLQNINTVNEISKLLNKDVSEIYNILYENFKSLIKL
jgi:TatD DNase family protein